MWNSFVYKIHYIFFSLKGVLLIFDYCISGAPKEDISNIPDDSKDVEDLDESDSQKLLKPKKTAVSVPTLIASSTPQRKTTTTTITKTRSSPVVEIQDDEALLDEVLAADQDDDDSEGLNTSDVAPATDEEEQTTNVSIRQRRANQ